jgi:cyclophilin family peptidyl-prolyl cis-trans isomerase
MRVFRAFVFALPLVLAGAAVGAPAPLRPAGPPVVVLDTSLGKITIELHAKEAPATVANFLRYVDDRFYDGTVIHRVIPNFVIQGGGMLPGLVEKPGRPPIKNEATNGMSNRRGTLSVARMVNPDSGTCQFFINLGDNPALNRGNTPGAAGYCVFGKVIAGMEVVDRIAGVATQRQGVHDNVPVQAVVIRTARRR